MPVPSQPLNENSSTLVPCNVYLRSETSPPNLVEQLSQLQITIQQLTETISQLETPSVFQPPHRLMPLEERLQLHFQSIQGEKERYKQLKKAKETLILKQEELKQLEHQLKQRQLEATATLKQLESFAQVVKHRENAYAQAVEEFKAMAQQARQILHEVYGQEGQVILETEIQSQFLAQQESIPQLTPSS